MKLRNHPLLHYRGIRSWPPHWIPSDDRRGLQPLRGEMGILKTSYAIPNEGHCWLIMEHERNTYVGCLYSEDVRFCLELEALLAARQGRTIVEIGNIEFSRLPTAGWRLLKAVRTRMRSVWRR